MKAIRFHEFGGPEVLKLEEVPDPKPGDGDVLVSLVASGVNPSEVSRRAGRMGQTADFPALLGIEGAGTVAEVGKDVASVKVGDRLVVRQPPYSYAELVVVPERSVFVVPDNLGLVEASTIAIIYTTAWAALCVRGGAKAGDTILVQAAASGVGIAAIQLAKQIGATVIATASSAEKLDWAKQYGLDHGINYAEQDFVEEAKRLTDGRGVDVIVDGVGGDVLAKGINALARFGRLTVFGGAGGRETAFPRRLALPQRRIGDWRGRLAHAAGGLPADTVVVRRGQAASDRRPHLASRRRRRGPPLSGIAPDQGQVGAHHPRGIGEIPSSAGRVPNPLPVCGGELERGQPPL